MQIVVMKFRIMRGWQTEIYRPINLSVFMRWVGLMCCWSQVCGILCGEYYPIQKFCLEYLQFLTVASVMTVVSYEAVSCKI